MNPEQVAQLLFNDKVELYCYAAVALVGFFIGLLILKSSIKQMYKREKEG